MAPRWSPDSRSIVFYTTWGDEMTDLRMVSIEGGAFTRLNRSSSRPTAASGPPITADAIHSQWLDAAPDGRLVYARLEAFDDRRSVRGSSWLNAADNVASDVSPSWSAHGSTFFFSATDGDADLWVERF